MSMQTVTRQEFEEGLREDGVLQPERGPLGGLIDMSEKQMTALLGTSADDCSITLSNRAERFPVDTLQKTVNVLSLMNSRGIEKKAHRQAMLRACRKALNKIGEFKP